MPALTPVVESLDKVPESARQFYEPKDGKFSLILDAAPAGFVAAADAAAANGKVVEFRDRNIALLQEVELLRPIKAQFDGVDPVAAKAALAKVAALGSAGVNDPKDIATQIAAAVKPIQDALALAQAATADERKRADKSVLRGVVTEKFIKAGGVANAVDYIITKAEEAFKVADGAVTALPTKFSTARPGEALGLDEWLAQAAVEHDFAFKPSTGAGAAPKPGAGAARPGQTILRDPTPKQLGEFAKDIATGKMRLEYTA